MGVVQFMNYSRPVQFIVHVSALNESLQRLNEKVSKLKTQSDLHDEVFNLDYLSTSTLLYNKIEVYRETFNKIWSAHESLNRCFGFSILVITLNALMTAAFSFYFSILSLSKNITVAFIIDPSLHMLHILCLFILMIHTCETSNALVSSLKSLHWLSLWTPIMLSGSELKSTFESN